MGNIDLCELVILETSDIHGNIFPVNYGNNMETNSGLGKIASIIKKEREQYPLSLLIDNGDVIQGTPLTYHYARFMNHAENPIISILNYLQYDAAVIGNHEFNYGLDLLQHSIRQSSFPWMSANILDEHTKESLFGKPYFIKEFDNGLRVAVLGVTTHYIPNWENPSNITGIQFDDALETTKKWVKHLQAKERYDLLVVSYHGGFERDIETGEPTESLTSENQGYQIAVEIEGIDVLLTGHQHRAIATELNGVTIVQPSFNGHSLGKVHVNFEQQDGKWVLSSKKTQLIEVDETVQVDKNVLVLAQELEDKTQE